ncbi:hypothetical protein D3C84_477120 [compost metagenome]
MPGLGLGQGQQRQPRRPGQAAGAGKQGTQQADGQSPQPPGGAEIELPGHLGAIQAAQAGHHIGQQQAGQPVAAEHAGQAAEQGQGTELQGQGGDQQTQAHPAGPQGTQQGAALLQGQADSGVDDEQPDDEGQQAERGEVEVEALAEPGEVGSLAAMFEHKLCGQLRRQARLAAGEVAGQQQP